MKIQELLENNPVIAAVRGEVDFKLALNDTPSVVFMLNANILTLKEQVEHAHEQGKTVFVHADLTEGLGKDAAAMAFLQKVGVDGVISTRTPVIRLAKECGMCTVQRFFMVDSHSLRTALDAIRTSSPDLVELMPGVIPKIVTMFRENCTVPVIAGGLIDTKEEILAALSAGAAAVSTGCRELWNE